MSTTVYFARNGAFFVKRTVIKELTEEEAAEVTQSALGPYATSAQIQSMATQAHTADVTEGRVPPDQPPIEEGSSLPIVPQAPPLEPQKKRRARRRRHPVTITSTITDVEDLLDLVGSVISKQKPPVAPAGIPMYGGGGSSGLSSCNEQIEIERMDEGFCVTHHKPVDKQALEDATRVEGDEWKGSVPGWAHGLLQLMGGNFAKGPVVVHGFRKSEEVVAFVRDVCGSRQG